MTQHTFNICINLGITLLFRFNLLKSMSLTRLITGPAEFDSKAVFPNLGPPDVLGLQVPEAFTTTSAG